MHLEAPSSLLLKKNVGFRGGGDSFYCSHYQDKFEHSGCTERAKNKMEDTCATQTAFQQLRPWNGTGGGRARRSFVLLCLHNDVCVFLLGINHQIGEREGLSTEASPHLESPTFTMVTPFRFMFMKTQNLFQKEGMSQHSKRPGPILGAVQVSMLKTPSWELSRCQC